MNTNKVQGFSLLELMVVVAIIAISIAIVRPLYKQYTVKAKRTDVETAMVEIARKLEAYKLVNNDYGATNPTSGYASNPLTNPAIFGYSSPNTQPVYPQSGVVNYNLTITASPTTSWTITATPRSGTTQAGDGPVLLNEQGWKCWTKGTTCTLSATSKWE